MTRLERRCRLLLRAYPAAYRQERGEEIIGTLLDATPDGRAWPRPRDVRALAIGGLRARASLNRQQTTAANLRAAVLVGITAYLCLELPASLVMVVRYERELGVTRMFWEYVWPGYLIQLTLVAAAALAWLSRRRLVILPFVLLAAAVVLYAGFSRGYAIGSVATDLAYLAALLLSGGGRESPSRRWLWPLGLILVITSLLQVGDSLAWRALWVAGMLAVCAVSLAWLVIDARPAIALAVCVLALWLPLVLVDFRFGFSPLDGLPVLVSGMLGAGAFWRLRRQSAP